MAERGWTWIDVDTAGLKSLGSNWTLLVDNTRFSAIIVRVDTQDRRIELRRGEAFLADNGSLGNNLRFGLAVDGKAVTAMRIGFLNADGLVFLRSVRAMEKADYEQYILQWTVLIAVVTGILFSAFCYNLFLLTWLRMSFQRWYVVWVAGAMAYMLVWSGGVLQFMPFLAGPAAMRTSVLLVGLLMVSGAGFFFALMEPGKVPRRLVIFGQFAAAVTALAALAAAFDMLFPAVLSDRILNLGIVALIFVTLVASVFAFMRGSRAIWFYTVGWTPALIVLGMRIARNFDLLPQSDFVDQASFAAIGWESLLLSLAIADRFRQLRRDTDSAEAERTALLRFANSDPLTGLGNRALFQSLLDQATSRRSGIDLIAVDIDFLKQTNDLAGHDAGDALIVAVAERLAAAAGPLATIARIGGDEFAILLEGEARARLPAVRQMIMLSAGVPMRHAGHDLTISICAGHAASDDGEVSIARIFKQADLALYSAKAAGRGCWRSYDGSMADAASARLRLVNEARTGLNDGEFILHYQPLVRLDGKVAGHKALLRWQHPRLGLLVPAEFADVMSDAAIVSALQAWMVSTAIAEAARLQSLSPEWTMAVNFAAEQLQGTEAAVAILEELARRRLQPSALVVDITEAALVGGALGSMIECLECLRDAGVQVALADFGMGSASLVQLRDIPANMIKIDHSFVAELGDSAGSQQIVRALIDMAHSLGKKVVAQGVETAAQSQVLRQLGCDFGEGALFSQPSGHIVQLHAAA